METNRRPLIAAATLLGIGLGGFVDGILFHQILQFHNMLSGAGYFPKTGLPPETIVVNMEINMFWDGLFHVLTWCMTVAGLTLLWQAGKAGSAVVDTNSLRRTLTRMGSFQSCRRHYRSPHSADSSRHRDRKPYDVGFDVSRLRRRLDHRRYFAH